MDVIENCDPAEWDAFAAQHPESFLFHTSAWRSVVDRTYGHPSWHLAAIDSDGVCGILPLVQLKSRLFGNLLCSLPYVTVGGVCANNETARDALAAYAIELGKKLCVGHVMFRQMSPAIPGLVTHEHKVLMQLPLASSVAAMEDSFRSEIRNRIRKAEKAGLEADICGRDGLNDFYHCFAVNMRDLGTPVYARTFFENMFDLLGDNICIVRVRRGSTVIGAGIMVFYRDRVELPWVSSLRKYFDLAPNNLLYWEAIQAAIGRGMKTFDFGRSTRDAGTYQFKKRWGAKPQQLYWQYWTPPGSEAPDISPANPKFGVAIRAWKVMPVFMTKIIGPPLVKCIP